MLIEIVAGHLEAAIDAEQAGAQRLELCSCLAAGGITPSGAFIKQAKENCHIPLMVLIRPREGHFVYSVREKKQIIEEIKSSIDSGADGLVIGALDSSGKLDLPFLEQMVKACNGKPITHHRAFDRSENAMQALEEIIGFGIERILTSGQAKSAWEGREMIKALIEKSAGCLTILPGAGINSKNAKPLADFTGCSELHFSAKGVNENTQARHALDSDYWSIDFEEAQKMIAELS